MNVTYKNTLDDLENVQRYILKNTKYGRALVNRIFFTVTVATGLFCILATFITSWIFTASLFTAMVLFSWFRRYNGVLKRTRKTYSKDIYKDIFETVTVTIEEEGFRTERESGGSLYKWNIVDHVTQRDNYIFIILKGRGNAAIPLGAFKTTEESQEFYNKLVEKIGKTTPGI